MSPASPRDRARGALLGLAAGDRNGGPIRMAVRLAESLADRRGLDLADIGARYVQWWKEGAIDTGPVTGRVLARVADGADFTAAAAAVDRELDGLTAGCNPAHRAAPLAMCAALADRDLVAAARSEAALTHTHALAGDVAAVVVVLSRRLLRGVAWSQLEIDAIAPDDTPSTGGFAPDVLGAALWFHRRARAFGDTLTNALRFAGGANYCPVLVGALGGARWGAAAIDPAHLEHLGPLLPRVRAAADRLAADWPE